jgi:hypothetical protein
MGKCEDKQKTSCIIKTNYKHSKGGYRRRLLGNVYTCRGSFFKMHKFEETDSRTFFHKFTQQFVDRGLRDHWELVINKILKTPKTILCSSRQASLVATRFKN